jgi:hypothetical protein
MKFLFRVGLFEFCSRLKNTALYFSGTNSAVMQAGIERYDPVKGGESFSSRYRCATMAPKFPPAEMPLARKPFLGLPPRSSKFAAVLIISGISEARVQLQTHFKASNASSIGTGNGCSGASL